MKLSLRDYIENTTGTGVLSTADSDGRVDAAIYARPHIFDDGSAVFLMRDHLTHHNLGSNPHAAYLFIEDGEGHQGIRLFLRKIGEETDKELLASMTRRHLTPEEDAAKGPKFLVRFAVERILPLIGDGDTLVKH